MITNKNINFERNEAIEELQKQNKNYEFNVNLLFFSKKEKEKESKNSFIVKYINKKTKEEKETIVVHKKDVFVEYDAQQNVMIINIKKDGSYFRDYVSGNLNYPELYKYNKKELVKILYFYIKSI